jgi:hypothetical protein
MSSTKDAHSFVDRQSTNYTEEIRNLPVIKESELGDLNDPKYNWIMVGNDKYGRTMYCTNTNIRRGLTMGEFYGSGIVD